jgi:DNA modification methylase
MQSLTKRALRAGQLSLLAEPAHRLPTNLTTYRHPVHRWFNFIAGFSPEFVTACFKKAGLKSDDTVIDPFAGLCTVLVQANLEGLSSIGFETHPFFYDIATAKLYPPNEVGVIDAIEACAANVEPYRGNLTDLWSPDATAFLTKLIPEVELRLLLSALQRESQIEPMHRPLFRLVISRVLELAAGSQTDGIYKAPTTKKKSKAYLEALSEVSQLVRDDLPVVRGLAGRGTLYPTTSEQMVEIGRESCSLCITSPPYLNNFDFAEMTRMELYFWRYASSWSEITDRVRRRLIVNTTTAPADLKRDARFASSLSAEFRSRIDPIVEALEAQRAVRAGKKEYDRLVYPYFSQLQATFRELARVLKPGSPFHLIIGDAALYGIHVRTHTLLAELMAANGFEVQNVERLRTRGERWILDKRTGAQEPLGEYEIYAKRL